MIPSKQDKTEDIKSQIGNLRGVDGKDHEYYRLLKKWWFDHGETLPPYGWAWKQALNHARTLKDYGVTKKDEKLIMSNARQFCSKKQGIKGLTFADKTKVTENDIDREAIRLHLERVTKIG